MGFDVTYQLVIRFSVFARGLTNNENEMISASTVNEFKEGLRLFGWCIPFCYLN